MAKKIIIAIVILAVVGAGVVYLIPWGEYESKVEKSEVSQTVEKDSTGAVVPSLSLIEGMYVANSKDSANAELLFDVDGLKQTKGAFESFAITFDVKADWKTSELTVDIESASINTNNGMRDEHLMEEDFFDVKNHSNINFFATTIVQSDTGYIAKGDLTLLGNSKALDVPFEHLGGGSNDQGEAFEAFEGTVTFDRTNYGMEEVSGAGNVVTMHFYCEMTKQ